MPSVAVSDSRELAETWLAILGRLEVDMNPHTFKTWLDGARFLRMEDGVMLVEAKNSFVCDHVNEALGVVLQRAAYAIVGEDLRIRFVPAGAPGNSNTALMEPPSGGYGTIVGQLNAAYTFGRYYIAEANRLAADCCRSLCEREGPQFSPIVIYGAPGLGKTHLLHAVAGAVAGRGASVACLTAEQFTNGYLSALRSGDTADFQHTVRTVRLLVLDDLQYLSGTKKATQDELAHTIDAVGHAGGAVVIASERHPAHLELPDRLASRLEAGISTSITPFTSAERRGFVARLVSEQSVPLPSWAVDRISSLEFPSVRALQGAVNRAVALQKLAMLTPQSLEAGLTYSAVVAEAPRIEPEVLIDAVAAHFRLNAQDILGKARSGQIPQARAVAGALLREQGEQNAAIARALHRDRSTIGPVIERGVQILEADPHLRRLATG